MATGASVVRLYAAHAGLSMRTRQQNEPSNQMRQK